MIYDIQKASVTKRFAAFLLDIILIACLAVGFMALVAVICKYDTHYKTYTTIVTETQKQVVEEYKTSHGVDLGISKEDYDKLTAQEQEKFNTVAKEAGEELNKRLMQNETYVKESMLVLSFTLMMTTIGIFLSVFVLEFVFPLIFKNGQTIGKKVFSIAVMHTNGVRVRPFSMFVRAILGMYVFEIMVPVLVGIMMFFNILNIIIGTCVLVAILILQIAVFISTRNTTKSFLHDLMARTVVVDLSSQMIFDSEEERLEFVKAEQRELEERNAYREGKKFDFYNSSLNQRHGRKIVDENGKEIVYEDEKKSEGEKKAASGTQLGDEKHSCTDKQLDDEQKADADVLSNADEQSDVGGVAQGCDKANDSVVAQSDENSAQPAKSKHGKQKKK